MDCTVVHLEVGTEGDSRGLQGAEIVSSFLNCPNKELGTRFR